MGILSKFFQALLGGDPAIPERRKEKQSGAYWVQSGAIALAAGRGFNQPVVGESFYRDTLERLTGGATRHGVLSHFPVELAEGLHKGAATIDVRISGERVGAIPSADLPDLLNEIATVRRAGLKILAKGKVSDGFEGGHYSVSISLARPLRIRE